MRFIAKHRKKIYSIIVVLVCLAVAGPEIGVGFELVGLVDLLGIELFVLCFSTSMARYGDQRNATEFP